MARDGVAVSRGEFPTQSRLWRGAILCTLVEAVRHARHPTHFDCYWRAGTHLLDNEQGSFGAVVFARHRTVAGFFDHESPRSPWAPHGDIEYDWRRFFSGIPADLLAVTERILLPEMEADVRGVATPTVTSALWGTGEVLTAAEPWESVFNNGASILSVHLMDFESALESLRRNYRFSSSQGALIESLFDRRVSNSELEIRLSPPELEVLVETGAGGIGESRELLGAIGVVLP